LAPAGTLAVNVAVTDRFELRVRMQAPVPEQAPPQPPKVHPLRGEAVSVTCVPMGCELLQLPDEQLVAAGSPVTLPPLETVTLRL
jgi:hypothetical protein